MNIRHVFGICRSSCKYWRLPKKPDVIKVALLSPVREVYCENNGSADARSITAMVITKGITLSCWRVTKLMKALKIIRCHQVNDLLDEQYADDKNSYLSLSIIIGSESWD